LILIEIHIRIGTDNVVSVIVILGFDFVHPCLHLKHLILFPFSKEVVFFKVLIGLKWFKYMYTERTR